MRERVDDVAEPDADRQREQPAPARAVAPGRAPATSISAGKADHELLEARPHLQERGQMRAQRQLDRRRRDVALVPAAHQHQVAGAEQHDARDELQHA